MWRLAPSYQRPTAHCEPGQAGPPSTRCSCPGFTTQGCPWGPGRLFLSTDLTLACYTGDITRTEVRSRKQLSSARAIAAPRPAKPGLQEVLQSVQAASWSGLHASVLTALAGPMRAAAPAPRPCCLPKAAALACQRAWTHAVWRRAEKRSSLMLMFTTRAIWSV